MAEKLTNSALLNLPEFENAKNHNYAIIVAEWHQQITEKLRDGALKIFAQTFVPIEQINIFSVPGSFELPLTAKWAVDHVKADAVICLGCIIKGETKHDEYIAHSVSDAIMRLNLDCGHPIIFGVLTVDKLQQAEDRAGGKFGNKGEEAAIDAIKMLFLKKEMNA